MNLKDYLHLKPKYHCRQYKKYLYTCRVCNNWKSNQEFIFCKLKIGESKNGI